MCDRTITEESLADFFRETDVLCTECRSKWKRIGRRTRFAGVPAFLLYEYNEAFSDCLIQFKECKDEALKPVFLYPDRRRLRWMFRGRTLLLLPSSREKREERGFSHLREMFEILRLPMMEPFEKREDRNQKQSSRKDRLKMERNLVLRSDASIPKKVVLADDVITTGATMRGALACLPRDCDAMVFACALTPGKEKQKKRRKRRFLL